MKRKQKRPAPVIESLEPRILLSADFPGLDAPDVDPNDPWNANVDQILTRAYEAFEAAAAKSNDGSNDAAQASAVTSIDEPEALAPTSELDSDVRRELIIVDPTVEDHELLLAGVTALSGEDTRLDVVLIDPQRSGIDQISEILSSRNELGAIHLISHGSDAAILIGGDTMDAALLQREPDTFSAWGGALDADGDILIYGCDVAMSDAGRVLIDALAELTHADVAASDDLTGHVSQGGDWDLEYRSGSIETDLVVSRAVQATWQGSLEQTLWLSTDSNVGPPGADGMGTGWTEGQVLNFGGPALNHGVATDGDLSLVIDFDSFTSAAVDTGAIHHVSRDITVGAGANTFDLKAGDVLVSFLHDATILAAHSSTGSDTAVDDQDLLVFRPNTINDYSAGTFTILLDDVVADDLKGVTLIEQDTTIGGTDVAAGSFLVIAEASGTTSVDLFEPTGVGVGTTTGAVTPFIDLSGLGIDANRLRGIEVIEAETTVGGQTLAKGSVLATLNVDDNASGVGSNNLLVDLNDVFVLNLTSTGPGATTGTAAMFLDGSMVGLDNNPGQENPYALSLHNYSQLTVNTTSDVSDGDTSSIENLLLDKGADGKISLREAIEAANATPNGDVADHIHFEILDPLGGDGAHTISITSTGLPFINDAVVIDGTTDADFSGSPIIVLDGSSSGGADGLTLAAGSDASTIRGLVIHQFATGISITNSDNNVIHGNYVGADHTGISAPGNTGSGIAVYNGSSGNLIGGSTAAEANVLAGNQNGIGISGVGTSGNVIQGNYIGSDISGAVDLGNTQGIAIWGSALNNLVGGMGANEGNTIASNTRGVTHNHTSVGNAVLGNAIYANDLLGRDLLVDGVTYNDAEDADTGPNDGLNFPVLTNVVQSGADLDIDFELDLPAGQYRIEFFDNPNGLDANSFGEGEQFIGYAHITVTGAAGYESFSTTLSGVTASNVLNITTTATEADASFTTFASTSEFGPNFQGAGVLTVTTTGDNNDAGLVDGDADHTIAWLLGNRGADGEISLREAMIAANNTTNGGSPDEIRFSISDPLVGGMHTIDVSSVLPTIRDAVLLDGWSEPDHSNDPVIRLDGNTAGAVNGLTLDSTSDGSTVRGLMITRFNGFGIQVDLEADGNTIAGNWIGTTGTGSTGVGNTNSGINVQGANTIIGGTGANDGNVITNNNNEGINLTGVGATGTFIQGNIIGLDPDGATGAGNADVGIALLSGSHNTTVGGNTAAHRNVISANYEGIEINSNNNTVQGNYIGTDIGGTLDRGNDTDDGVEIQNGATGNLIGGTDTGEGNLIAFNALAGVNIFSGADNTVVGNAIHSNVGLGINLGVAGVAANDADDTDGGANNLQNYPVITQADLAGTDLTVSGALDTDGVTTQYRIEFFGVASGNEDLTNGEGRYYLGSTTVTTDGGGDAVYSNVTLSGVTLSVGDYVTATATRIDSPAQVGVDDQLAYGNTSEFAQNIAIAEGNLAPTDLRVSAVNQGGVALNNDGGNDVYFVADDGGGLLGGLTTLTIEATFSIDTPAADNTVLLSYADGANDEELGIFLKNDGSIWFCAHSPGSPYQATSSQYPQLFDGEAHQVSISWDATNGAVDFYVDGQPAESFTGYQTGQMLTGTGELVLGQDQDSVLGGFNPIDVFSGTLYDVRIFDDVRTPVEVASGHGQTLPNTEPGMIANWTFGDMSGSGVVTDTVSGNNLTEQHVGVGGGFTTSVTGLALEVAEGAGYGTVVGTLATIDPNTGDTFTYTLLDDAGGRFDIGSGTGVITVANGTLLNHEADPSHTVTVRVTDSGGLTYDEVFTILVSNVNEAPVNHLTPPPETVASNSIDGATDIHAADLNGDGDVDLVSSSYGDDRIVWFENDGAGNLTAIDVATGVLGAREVFVADVDGDGHKDILSAAYEQESVVWYENDGAAGTPTFTAHTIALGEGQASTVFATDIDGDGDTDVVVGYQDTDEVVWYENDGPSFTRNVITNLTNGVKSVVAGDLDGDGDVDVAAVSYVGDTVDWFENDGTVDPVFARHSVTTTLLGQMSMEIADVDGDGNGDLVVASYFDGKIAWYQNDGAAVAPTFSENIVSTSAAGARDVEVADLDGDGDADIVAASYTENRFSWYESDGAASPSFVERAITLDAGGPRSVAVADMDGDLDLDVVGAAYTGDTVGYFENTDGSMGVQVTAEETPLTFNAANNNLVSISDVDAGAGELKVRLEITDGTLSLSGIAGLALDVGTGTDDAIVEFRGNLTDINNALNGMVFTPTQDHVGIASIRIITDDQGNSGSGGALVDDDTINITVTPVNDDPVISSDGGGDTANINVAEASKLATMVVSSDVDGGTPTYSISGGNDALLFDIDPVTGELTFKTLPDFENPTDNGTNNVYEVQVTVNDGNSGTDMQTINVTVTNRAPVANPDGPSSWFDETDGGAGYSSFGELAGAYDAFIGATAQTVDLESLADATVLSNQFSGSHGVTFSNAGAGASGVYTEGAAWIENVTGYDGSWSPDGSKVYLKMGNDVPGTPFTIDFATPVAKVGALLGMGKEGASHSVVVSLYDSGGGLIDQQTFDAELWDATGTDQNYETFFGARYDTAIISKIEILNASNVNYANALIFDQLTWSHTPDAGYVFDASTAVPLVTGNVLANDVDPVGGTLTFVGNTQPANGSVVYNGDGTFTYTSDLGYTGIDAFDYTISDDDGLTDTATVTIQVSNAAPTTTGIADVTVAEDAVDSVIDLYAAFADVEDLDPALTYTITNNTNAGLFTSTNIASGNLTLDYAPNANGTADITVRATDTGGLWVESTFTVTVNPQNDTPTTGGIADVTVAEDAVDSIVDLYAAFADVEDLDPALTYTITNNTNAGLFTSTIIASGNLTLDYAPNSNGTADITVRATDTGGLWVDSTFTVTVNPQNDNPTTTGIADVTVAEDAVDSVIDLYAAFADVEDLDPALTYTITNNTNAGLFTSTNIASGNLTLDYAPNSNGTADITVRATDTGGLWVESTFTVTVNPQNDTPTTSGIADVTVAEDAVNSVIDLYAAFADVEDLDPALTYTITGNTNAALFTSTNIGSGNLTLDYAPNANGTADITVRATDTGGLWVESTFTVTVNPQNDTPTTSGIADVTVAEDAVDSVIDLYAAFADVEDLDPALTYTITNNTNAGLFTSTNIASGNLTLDYAPNANGTADITVRATDTGGLWVDSTFTVTVNPQNDNPTTSGIADVTVAEDAVNSVIDLYAAFADVEDLDPALTYTITGNTNAPLFTSTNIASGNLTLDYAPSINGTADITVRATDTGGLWVESTFTVTITAVNNTPTTTGLADVTVAEDDPNTVVDLFAAFADVEDLDPALIYTITTNTNSSLFTSTPIDGVAGTLTLGYAPDANGTADITVRATDSSGLWVESTFTVTVTAANDFPVIGGVSVGTVTEDLDPDADDLLETSGTLTIADPDAGESNFVAGSITGSHGYLVIDASGNWDYVADDTQTSVQQLDAGQSTNDVLTVTSADGTSHDITVTILGAEDVAVVSGLTTGSVAEDGTLVASGTLSISDADASDNPVGFPDEATTPGDNGYGHFQLTGGNWSYALSNGHAAVQALGAGASLTDTHTFIASDGTSRVVSIVISGAAEVVPQIIPEPPMPEPIPEPEGRVGPPPETEATVESPLEEEPESAEPPPSNRTDPSAGEGEAGESLKNGFNSRLPEPLEPGEILLSVISDARPDHGPGIQKTTTAAAKPTVETAQTFLQELKSFWQEDSTATSIEMSEVRLSREFWDGLDKMQNDMDESVEEQDRKMRLSAEAAAGMGISLTAGFVSWALRAGSMAASFLAAMPSWRHFDPMPVLSADERARKEVEADADRDGSTEDGDRDVRVDELFERETTD